MGMKLQSWRHSNKSTALERQKEKEAMKTRCKKEDEAEAKRTEEWSKRKARSKTAKVTPSKSFIASDDNDASTEFEGWTDEEDDQGYYYHIDGRRGYYDEYGVFVTEDAKTSK